MMQRWPRSVMLVNLAFMVPLVGLGAWILWETAWVLFWLYLAVWVGILTLGRYFVCRTCPCHGRDCPSYGYGHLAALLFKRDETRGFNNTACVIDFAANGLAMLVPVVAWLLGFFDVLADFSPAEHAAIGIYLALLVAGVGVHQASGCAKCENAECSFSKATKARRTAVLP